MLEAFDNIFFDFDGTLCASEADIRLAWQTTIAEIALPCPDFDRYFKVGPAVQEMTAMLFPQQSAEVRNQIVELFKKNYDNSSFEQTVPYPWIDAWLKNLKRQGKKLYVLTNKRIHPTTFLIQKLNWANLFEHIFSPDIFPGQVLNKTQLLAQALTVFKLDPARTIMVGDTAGDVKTGQQNQVATLGVLWGYGSRAELQNANADYFLERKDFFA